MAQPCHAKSGKVAAKGQRRTANSQDKAKMNMGNYAAISVA
jgi:hypothetical protein